jgi:hypothetical protein
MVTSLARRSWSTHYKLKLITPLVALMCWINPNGNFRTPWKSAGDVLRAAFDTQTLGGYPSGIYLSGSAVAAVSAEANDKEKTGQLWRDSLGYADIKDGDTVLTDAKN